MRIVPPAALLLLAVALFACSARRGAALVGSPITIVLPTPVEGPTPSASNEPPRARPAPRITGEWIEEFGEDRPCSDRVSISGPDEHLAIESKNCTGGAEYAFDDIVYDGRVLTLRLSFVPENGNSILYRLKWGTKGALEGSAAVTTSEGTTTYNVRWHRP